MSWENFYWAKISYAFLAYSFGGHFTKAFSSTINFKIRDNLSRFFVRSDKVNLIVRFDVVDLLIAILQYLLVSLHVSFSTYWLTKRATCWVACGVPRLCKENDLPYSVAYWRQNTWQVWMETECDKGCVDTGQLPWPRISEWLSSYKPRFWLRLNKRHSGTHEPTEACGILQKLAQSHAGNNYYYFITILDILPQCS